MRLTLAIVLAAGPAALPAEDALKSLEASAFCKQYGCHAPQAWPLKAGGVNHSYQMADASISFEAQTNGRGIASYGLSFYERRALTSEDLAMVGSLIRSVHPGSDTPAVRAFVRSHVEVRVHQIFQAKSIAIGPYRLWAGKVGEQQVVAIRRSAQGGR